MEKIKPYLFELIGRTVVGLIMFFALLGLPSVTYSATITLKWDPPTTNSDGSPLVDLARYRLYFGHQSRNYGFYTDTNKPVANVSVSDYSNYYFAVTAINSNNVESEYSNEYFWDQVSQAPAILTSVDVVMAPEGGMATFLVKLNTAPVSPTTVTVSRVSGDPDIAVKVGGSLIFDAFTWNIYQTVTLSAAADPDWINDSAVIQCSAPGWIATNVTATEQDNTPLPLVITTTSLPNGISNGAYSATLTASGGTAPYNWSVAGGSLPPGITLSSVGILSGTPTMTGIFNFIASVSDAGSPVQITNKALSITIAAALAVTIWPSNAAPEGVDNGPDSAVELGVKFQSDVTGIITGIRFYKAMANTGVHVGNLWTSTGTLLGTATFSNETASGWQQVLFATPVAIASNTIYVASYHANNGHYSEDDYYFQGKGVDNPPLHALTNGVSDGNGVYAYDTSSAFPNQTYNAANYWVDVMFQAGPAPTLTSIAVTPVNSTIERGVTQQFTATGTYSDGSTQDLSNQATWTSSNTGVATINTGGLATGVAAGTTTISATLAGVSGNTVLAVQVAPLSITTTSPPAGVLNMAYSTALGASGGTLPHTWSFAGGSFPPGLTLTSTGAITGIPTAAGTFDFTAQVSDVGSPAQITNKALSITIATLSAVTIWPSNAAPGRVDDGPDSAVELGVKFQSDVAGTIAGIRFYKAMANTGIHVGNLWTSKGTLLGTATFSNETTSGWQQALFATPVAIASNTVYVASYHANNGHYSADYNYFLGKGVDNPPLHALTNGVSGGNGVYRKGTSSAFPNKTSSAANYWVDVVFVAGSSPAQTLTSITLTADGTSTPEAAASTAGGNVEQWPWVWTSGDLSGEWGATNLMDGNTNTMWIGNVGGEPWRVILDLGVVTDVADIQVMFEDTVWTNKEIIGSRDSEVWFDYLAETNEWAPLRYLYVNFWGDEHGAQPPAIREIIWRDR